MAAPNEEAPADDPNEILSQELQQYLIDSNVYDSNEMKEKREWVVYQLKLILQSLLVPCETYAIMKEGRIIHTPSVKGEIRETPNLAIFTYGSYSLDVDDPGSDIDVLWVIPNNIKNIYLQPLQHEDILARLEKILSKQSEVTEQLLILGTIVPVIKFKYSGVPIDLVCAKVDLDLLEIPNMIPRVIDYQFPSNESHWLDGMERTSVTSLNGYINISQIKAIVNENSESYRTALRCLKLWAKRRGIYSNIVGFLGGISLALLLCLVNQECAIELSKPLPSELVSRFFNFFSNWHWPSPAKLCRMVKHTSNLRNWDPIPSQSKVELMPTITPAFPSFNSSYNVSPSTFTIIKEEIQRGQIICQDIMASKKNWSALFEYSPFFWAYKNYFEIKISADNPDNFRAWKGWIESRLKFFIQQIEESTKLRLHAHLHPRDFMDPSNAEGRGNNCYFYVGLRWNKRIAMEEGQEFDLTQVAFDFRHRVRLRFNHLERDKMEIYIRYISAREIPGFVRSSDKGKRKRNPQPHPADNDEGNGSEKRTAVSPNAGDQPIPSPVNA